MNTQHIQGPQTISMRDLKSRQLVKCVEVRFILSDTQKRIRHRVRAKNGAYFTREHVRELLEQECANCLIHLPAYEFRIVEIAADHYNFIGELRTAPPELSAVLPTADCAARRTPDDDCERNPGGDIASIDSPASAAFPEDETRSPFYYLSEEPLIIMHGQCDEGVVQLDDATGFINPSVLGVLLS